MTKTDLKKTFPTTISKNISSTESWKIVFVLIGIAVVSVSAIQIIRKQIGSIDPGSIAAQIKPAEGIESVSDLDTDGDGLFDAKEEHLGTNPHNSDTDNDGFTDGEEIFNGYNPLSAAIDGSQQNSVKIFGEPRVMYENMQPTMTSASATSEAQAGVGGLGGEDEVILDSGAISDMLRQVNTLTNYSMPDISGIPINITQTSGKTPVENYMYDVLGIFSRWAPFDDEVDISNFIAEVQQGNYARVGGVIEAKEEGLKELAEIEVPEEMYDLHTQGLKLLIGGSNSLIALQGVGGAGGEEETMTLFSQIQYLVDQTQSLVTNISAISRNYDLPFVFE
ncbi:hypothetical protein ACFL1U_00495 [Patescibacteria group bacterium]